MVHVDVDFPLNSKFEFNQNSIKIQLKIQSKIQSKFNSKKHNYFSRANFRLNFGLNFTACVAVVVGGLRFLL